VILGRFHLVLELRRLWKGQDVFLITTALGRMGKKLSDNEGNRIFGDSSVNLWKLVWFSLIFMLFH